MAVTPATSTDERILYVTTGYRLVALNAKTGAMILLWQKAPFTA